MAISQAKLKRSQLKLDSLNRISPQVIRASHIKIIKDIASEDIAKARELADSSGIDYRTNADLSIFFAESLLKNGHKNAAKRALERMSGLDFGTDEIIRVAKLAGQLGNFKVAHKLLCKLPSKVRGRLSSDNLFLLARASFKMGDLYHAMGSLRLVRERGDALSKGRAYAVLEDSIMRAGSPPRLLELYSLSTAPKPDWLRIGVVLRSLAEEARTLSVTGETDSSLAPFEKAVSEAQNPTRRSRACLIVADGGVTEHRLGGVGVQDTFPVMLANGSGSDYHRPVSIVPLMRASYSRRLLVQDLAAANPGYQSIILFLSPNLFLPTGIDTGWCQDFEKAFGYWPARLFEKVLSAYAAQHPSGDEGRSFAEDTALVSDLLARARKLAKQVCLILVPAPVIAGVGGLGWKARVARANDIAREIAQTTRIELIDLEGSKPSPWGHSTLCSSRLHGLSHQTIIDHLARSKFGGLGKP